MPVVLIAYRNRWKVQWSSYRAIIRAVRTTSLLRATSSGVHRDNISCVPRVRKRLFSYFTNVVWLWTFNFQDPVPIFPHPEDKCENAFRKKLHDSCFALSPWKSSATLSIPVMNTRMIRAVFFVSPPGPGGAYKFRQNVFGGVRGADG